MVYSTIPLSNLPQKKNWMRQRRKMIITTATIITTNVTTKTTTTINNNNNNRKDNNNTWYNSTYNKIMEKRKMTHGISYEQLTKHYNKVAVI